MGSAGTAWCHRLSSIDQIVDSNRGVCAVKLARVLLTLAAALSTIPAGSAIGRNLLSASQTDAPAQGYSNRAMTSAGFTRFASNLFLTA
jgi:hypothetical protein